MAGKWNFGWSSGRLELVQDAFFRGVFFYFCAVDQQAVFFQGARKPTCRNI